MSIFIVVRVDIDVLAQVDELSLDDSLSTRQPSTEFFLYQKKKLKNQTSTLCNITNSKMKRAVICVLLLSVLAYVVIASRSFSICGNASGDQERDKGGVATLTNSLTEEEEVATLASELAEHSGVSEFLNKLRQHGLDEEADEEDENMVTLRFKRRAAAAAAVSAPRSAPRISAASQFRSAFNNISKNVRSNVGKHLNNFGAALRRGAQQINNLFGGQVGKSGSGRRGASEATKAGRVPTAAEIDDEIAYYGTAELPNNKCVTSCTWFILPGEGLTIGQNQDQICARCAKQYIVYGMCLLTMSNNRG